MNFSNLASGLIILFGSVVALIFGKALLFPFLIALLLYFLIRAIHRYVDRNQMIREKIPSWFKNLVASLFIFSLLGLIGQMLVINGNHLLKTFKFYESNITSIVSQINNLFGIDLEQKVSESLNSFQISKIINPVLNSITSIMGSFMMILFYLLFLFIEESNFRLKIHLVFVNAKKYEQISSLLKNIEHSITQYIGLKTFISFISAFICFLVLVLFGIDSALLWAFIVFFMNFIPVIGAFLAVLLPTAFAMIQFGELTYPLVLFASLGTIQIIIGNILEPKLMGDSLNISPLVALFALSFWGAIWGISGMIVSVPITVILIIILAQFPKTRAIAILLSNHGKV